MGDIASSKEPTAVAKPIGIKSSRRSQLKKSAWGNTAEICESIEQFVQYFAPSNGVEQDSLRFGVLHLDHVDLSGEVKGKTANAAQ